MNDKLLRIYLQDHYAGASAGKELARRCLNNNRGTALGDFLQTLIDDIESDSAALEELMKRVGTSRSPAKQAAVWMAEKVGRLKLNGQLTGYSDLSRLIELEGLCLAAEAKLSLWRALQSLAESDQRLRTTDFDYLIKRAEGQRAELESHRLGAAKRALT